MWKADPSHPERETRDPRVASAGGQPRSARIAPPALLLASLLLLATGAGAAYELREVRIPASFPDDAGNPVVLDASVAIPLDAGPPPYPAIILNHGFGGSRNSGGGDVRRLTDAGYIVLRWSQRGFGETGGEVDLMGEKERQDVLDAVNWLNDTGNVPEIRVDHIGQTGASYGSGHAMAYASQDHPAIKAIVPVAGWSDFYNAMAPYDVPKIAISGATWALAVPENQLSEEFHRIIAALSTGVNMSYAREQLQLRSEIHRLDNIRTPLFLVNGWNDSYFAAEEWLDIVPTLEANGVPVWLYFGGIGHPPAQPDTNGAEALHILEDRIIPFFDHFVRGEDNGFEHSPRVELSNTFWNTPEPHPWNGETFFGELPTGDDPDPFGEAIRMNLCLGVPTGTIQEAPCGSEVPVTLSNTFVTAHPGGEYLANYFAGPFVEEATGEPYPEGRTPTNADTVFFESAPLEEDLQLTGVPKFAVHVASASSEAPDQGPGPFQAFQLDPLVYEVAPDGSRRLITRGAYSENLDAPIGPHLAEFEGFGFSYRFRAGHSIRIEMSTNDFPYLRPASNPFEVVIQRGGYVDLPGAENLVGPFPLPEPGGMASLASGIVVLGVLARRRRPVGSQPWHRPGRTGRDSRHLPPAR